MRIGALIGRDEHGGFHYLGDPGQIDALDKLQRSINDAGGLHDGVRYVKTWLDDVASRPLKAKKCGNQSSSDTLEDSSKKAKRVK